MFGPSTNTPGTSFGTGTTLGSSLFGGSTNTNTGLFGSGLLDASGTTSEGTPVKFSELRIEDYEAGRKKEVFSVCTSSGSLFGNTSGSGFNASSSLTGLQPTTGFGAAGGSRFTFGSPALATNPVAPGGISLASLTTNAASSPFTEGLTPGKTSASTETSNTGFTFAGGSTQRRVGGFNFASAPLQELTANATSSPFTEELTPGKTSASTGTSNTGFTFAGGSTQPRVGGFNFAPAPSQGFTLEAGKPTALAMVNPIPVSTAGGTTTGASSASSGFTLKSDSVGGNPSSVLTLGPTPVTTTTSSLFLASTGFITPGVPVVASSSATPVIGLLSGLATTAADTATDSTASTGLLLGSTGASAVPGFSFPAASGFTFGAPQTTTSLSTATTTVPASLFGSSSKTAGLFGQQQTTDVLFNTTASTTVTGIKFGSKTSSTCGLATGLSVATSSSTGLSLPGTKSTGFDCGQTQADAGRELLDQTGLRMSQQQDDPPSLSPRFALSEAMSEGMEELRKENESLRKVIKMYKENEKAMEELRRFYTSQAIKHKENMEQAVSHKFLELVSKVRGLKTIRDTHPEDGKTSVVIREAIDLTRENRIDLESLKSLHKVQECESALQQAQECLRQCKDKEELLAADIVGQRDKARKELFESIEWFCQEVDVIPLQERENSLQHALSQLQEQGDALDSCSTDPDLEVAIEAYEEWLQRSRQDVTDVKQRVNQCTDDLTTALSRLELALKVSQDSSETVSIHAPFGDLDAMIRSLSLAIQEEMDKSQVSEDKEAKQIVLCAIKALDIELRREMADIQELRDTLVPKYKSLQTNMSPWLEAKPDLKNLEDVRTTIESLRLRLRQRLAEKRDLEEVERDISDIYLQLHKSFEDESNFLAELAKFTSEHFPELPIAHPEVGISEFLASDGLVKPGRELEHYPHYNSVPSVSDDKCSVIKTEFAGKPCTLKELDVDRELGDIETLQRKAVEFHSVDCPFLMPLDAFFVTGSRAFVQMPLLISGEEWLTSHECSSEAITLVLRDILDALNSLHLKNICHGSVHLQSVFVEKRSGVYRGVLDFFPFSNSQCSQTEDMKLFGDLIVKMNFPNKDPTTTFSQLTEDTDLLAVLGDLLDTDDVDRLTAQQTLQQAYFCKCV